MTVGGEGGFDLVVIGAGPGGYVSAIRAAQLGMRVAVVEREKLGGVCLNIGCIPSKAILRSAEVYALAKGASEFGVRAEAVGFDWPAIIRRSRRISGQLSKGVEFLMKKNKVEVIKGNAVLTGKQAVRVSPWGEAGGVERDVVAGRILVATGSAPRGVPGIDLDGKTVYTSNEALLDESFPGSVLIVGAGAIGLELCHIYQTFGAKVTLVELLDQVLPGADAEVSGELEKILRKRGVGVMLGVRVQGVAKITDGGAEATILAKGGKSVTVAVDRVLVAVGRKPLSDGLGLEALGVELNRGFVVVDDSYRTTCDTVHAIGDLTGGWLLAHKASAEGIACVEKMAGKDRPPVNPLMVPACVYCEPEVAAVGLTEAQAREKGHQVSVGKFPLRASGKALTLGASEGFVKVVADKEYGEILGYSAIGHGTTEMVSEITLAKAMELEIGDVARAIHPHPSLSEALMEATLAALGEAIHI